MSHIPLKRVIHVKFSSGLGTTPLTATAAMPSSSMRIFYGEASEGLVAENVKIGDPLSLVISIDEQVGGMMTYSDYFLIILVQLMNLLKAMVSFRILVVSSTLKDKNVH